jgi:alkanesulfonate monooxygenase SsuD/methylene tetrahydromethanopterin reductase-like flavin-dependent oxidoreductase (luciferase family)
MMEIGIGLPATIRGVEGRTIIEWARDAEQNGLSTLGVIDRLVYANYEPLITLAAAAAVTERIRLTTAVLLGPLRTNTALLAKQAASVDALSGGRLVLGIAVGGREDDYQAAGADFHRRGRTLDRQLEEMKRIWSGESRGLAGAIGPAPARAGGPQVIVGGSADAAIRRAVRYGDGWIAGGGGPEMFRRGAEAVKAAWMAAGRTGAPRLLALSYFSLGADAQQHAGSYLRDYYGFAGPYAERVVASAATSAEMVKSQAAAFEAAGCDELIFFPCSTDLNQVRQLTEALR